MLLLLNVTVTLSYTILVIYLHIWPFTHQWVSNKKNYNMNSEKTRLNERRKKQSCQLASCHGQTAGHSLPWLAWHKTAILWLLIVYVEIKCQLNATEVFIADLIARSTCFGHHCAHHQELKSIIQWLLPVVFRAVVFKLLVWCGAEGYMSGLQDAAARNTTGSKHCIILLSTWWWA